MNIIVTRNGIDYEQFIKVDSLKKATYTGTSIDYLVYNDSIDSEQEKTYYIDQLRGRVKKFIYIRDPLKGEDAVKVLMPALKGTCFDDEFFLEDEDELINMLDSLDEVTEIATMGGVSVVSDFFQKYLTEGSRALSGANNKAYLAVVKNAVKTMMDDYGKKNSELIQMSETATDIFRSTSRALVGSEKDIDKLKSQIIALEEKLHARDSMPVQSLSAGPALNFFPPVSYPYEKNIIRFKELGNVPFLTSFIMGFRIYLENVKNLRPKLIIVHQKGTFVEKAYNGFPWITQTTLKDKRNYFGSDIVFTNHPSSDVIKTILSDDDYDTFIVLDRSFYDSKHILNSKGRLFYAVGSPRYIKDFKLPIQNCISSVISKGKWLMYIDYDETYPQEKVNRERFYLQNYKSDYDLLLE